MNEIELYINGQQVDFDEKATNILFNYKETDLRNPTVMRNSFTKSVSLPSTNNNNDIFGHIWNLERVQMGYGFDALRRADFQLFVNGDKFEEGYCKLDSVKKKGNDYVYSVTLFGGIGDFISNLTYVSDESDVKKTLADLRYNNTQDLDFDITKENVNQAWRRLNGELDNTYDRWDHINFAVTSNGVPEDFASDKVLVNTKNFNSTVFPQSVYKDSTTYTALNGFGLGEASEEMTADETFDLRSYMLTPVFNMKKVIDACCDPQNNGGYEVIKDNNIGEFFSNTNPYWSKAWVTLSKIKDLEIKHSDTETISGGTLAATDGGYNVSFTSSRFSKFNGTDLTVKVNFTPSSMPTEEYLFTTFKYNASNVSGAENVKSYTSADGVVLQLVALDSFGTVVGESNKVYCSTDKDFGFNRETIEYDEFYNCIFKKEGNHYTVVNRSTTEPMAVRFSFPNNLEFTSLKLRAYVPNGFKVKYNKVFRSHSEAHYKGDIDGSYYLWKQYSIGVISSRNVDNIRSTYGVSGHFSAELLSMEISVTEYGDFLSGTRIPYQKLLATEHTPADYFLSYCKLFGLYLWQDPSEPASDPDLYPKGVIHLDTRNAFYRRDTVRDIQNVIDRSSEISITPVTPKSKWYEFNVEGVESETLEKYRKTYGFDYGRQLVNTNYEFDRSTTNLYDGNVFKSAVMVQEKDKYFSVPVDGVPAYVWNGFKYYLYHSNAMETDYTTYEKAFDIIKQANTPINFDGLQYYDCFEKCQLRTDEGQDVLLFFDQFMSTNNTYWLTDDLDEMMMLNDGEPCWLLTRTDTDRNNNTIAIGRNTLPLFTRTLYGSSHQFVTHSWDFGNPMETFVPDSYNTDEMGLYYKYWKTYIEDVYDEDARILTCKIIPEERWGIQSMRDFYWFDNSIWRLNAITDYDPASNNTVKMEFIKVQDKENYKIINASAGEVIYIVWNSASIGYNGGTMTGYVYSQGGDGWYVGDSYSYTDEAGNTGYTMSYGNITPLSGSGQRTAISVMVPANYSSYQRTWDIPIEDNFGNWWHFTFVQTARHSGYINIADDTKTIGNNAQTVTTTYTSSNIDGSISGAKNDPNNMITSYSFANGILTIQVGENTSSTSRSASVVLYGFDMDGRSVSDDITIIQSGGQLDVSTDHLEFDYDSTASQTFTVTSSGQFEITQTDYE